MPFTEGSRAEVELVVSAADTAIALGSGDVEVLGTPRLVALVEQATVAAVAPDLTAGETTVGTRVELDHLTATPVGRTVVAAAVLVGVDGRRLTFDVTVHEGRTLERGPLLARGRVERVVVDRQRFLTRAGS